MMPVYVKLFNIVFNYGIVPDSWSIGDILPIYKNKGSASLPENYRPITLLSCLGKLFTSIINNRLNKFAEDYNVINPSQAGFRKGFSTVDNIFIIQSLIEISKISKNKLFCAFIDFKQAFDMVWRNGLWSKLINSNINGKCFKLIRNMYNNIKSRISTAEGTSAYFPCNCGVRQGENLSPFLFSLYLNDLEYYLYSNSAPGVKCETYDENIFIYLKIFILLYADDTVLFGNNEEDLQTTLNIFDKYCEKWKLTVNVQKTKVLIFSSGRPAQNQAFYFRNNKLDIVSEYKYLGIYLSRSGSYLNAKKHIADQANNAMSSLLRKIRILNLPLEIQIQLFDKMIKPILLYGCEIWGFGNLELLERVQLKFLKYVLNLKKSTPSFMVYGETGIFPLSLDIQARIVSFWTKLLQNADNNSKKLSSYIYDIIYNLNEQGKCKSKWLENVKSLIQKNGFGNIWQQQQSINKRWFNLSFKQKIKDQYLQTWDALVNKSSCSLNYRIFKTTFGMNDYFSYLSNQNCRILTAFKTRNHRLPIETGRWTGIPVNERLCNLCKIDIGDEYYYIMVCDYFKDLRKKLIRQYYIKHPNTIKFFELMNNRNKKTIVNLCAFIKVIVKTTPAFRSILNCDDIQLDKYFCLL